MCSKKELYVNQYGVELDGWDEARFTDCYQPYYNDLAAEAVHHMETVIAMNNRPGPRFHDIQLTTQPRVALIFALANARNLEATLRMNLDVLGNADPGEWSASETEVRAELGRLVRSSAQMVKQIEASEIAGLGCSNGWLCR